MTNKIVRLQAQIDQFEQVMALVEQSTIQLPTAMRNLINIADVLDTLEKEMFAQSATNRGATRVNRLATKSRLN